MVTRELEQTREAWNKIAAGYDTYVTTPSMPLAEDALRRAGIRRGMHVLDVATGCGSLAIPAARLGADVVAVDLSPRMVERVKARARGEGLSNLEGQVMDGHALELEDDAFDIAGSQFGVMLFPDLPRALKEMARVTRPGGRVLMIVYGPPPTIEFLGFFISAMQVVVPGFEGLPSDPPPLPFQVSDPEVLRQRLMEAGLSDIRIEAAAEKLELYSGTDLWNWVVNSNPIAGMLIADLTNEQKAAVQHELDRKIRERSGGSGPAVLTNPVHIGIGTK